jgi:5-methylcytosine-specific restriction protein A
MKTCAKGGCPALVPVGTARCPVHGPKVKPRPSTTAQGYGASWRRKRAAFIAAHPVCQGDGAGGHHPRCDGVATVPDHDPLTRRELVARGDPDPDAWHHLVARSAACHGRKTALFDGAWGNKPKVRGS